MTISTRIAPTHYIVQTAAAPMPSSCWGVYRRVAVLEVEAGVTRASMISTHARGVRRVVQTWERLNVGHTARCAYARALAAAERLAAEYNGTSQIAHSTPHE
jgi:hypothetical protein